MQDTGQLTFETLSLAGAKSLYLMTKAVWSPLNLTTQRRLVPPSPTSAMTSSLRVSGRRVYTQTVMVSSVWCVSTVGREREGGVLIGGITARREDDAIRV